MQPFVQLSHGEADRTFHKLVNDQKSMVNQYPDDFDLYYIGEYETTSGKLTPLQTPEHMLKAVQVLNNTPQHIPQTETPVNGTQREASVQ